MNRDSNIVHAPSHAGEHEGGVQPHEWEVVADDVMAAVNARVEPLARKAAEDFYATLLEAAHDYLCDNAKFNIGSTIGAAQRQALTSLAERNDALAALAGIRRYVAETAAPLPSEVLGRCDKALSKVGGAP